MNHLTASWKVIQGVTQHIDIVEAKKSNDFSLGECLQIGEQDFEDFDEIMARHINPMAAFVREIMTYKYYKAEDFEDRDTSDAYLKAEQQNNPKKIHYLISASRKLPGKFVLSYLPKRNVLQEYITLTPIGFRYRNLIFPNLVSLITYFKANYKTPPAPSSSIVSGGDTPSTIVASNEKGSLMLPPRTPFTPFSYFGPATPHTPFLGSAVPGTPSRAAIRKLTNCQIPCT